jgi:hypothetical protein
MLGRGPRMLLLALVGVLCCAAFAPALASAAEPATIEGVLTDSVTAAPIEGARACIVSLATAEETCAETNSLGRFAFPDLEAGEYMLDLTGLVCDADECAQEYIPKAPFRVFALEGQATTAHTELVPYGSIEGTVTKAAGGSPIADLKVEAEGLNGENGGTVETDASGHYAIHGLQEGEYKVVFSGQTCVAGDCTRVYAERYWDDIKPQDPATPVVVTDGVKTEGIDAALELLGSIRGKVTDAAHDPIAKTFVCTNSLTEYYNTCVVTNSAGEYELPQLPPGEFNVVFTGRVCTTALCELEACELDRSCPRTYIAHYWPSVLTDEEATLVTVTAGQAHEDIDQELAVGGQIKGKVTVAALGAPPLAGFVVCGSGQTTPAVGYCTTTDAAGEYVLEGLGASDWLVEFKEACPEGEPCAGTYETQFYDGKAEAEATLVHLTAPEVKAGVNASIKELTPQVPAFTANPVASGVPVVGRQLSCTEGAWTGNPTAIGYAWLRNGVPIPGAEAAAYTTVAADANEDLTCEVTVSNSAGSKKALSNNVHIGPEVAPVFFIQPSLLGTAAVGSTLECIEGAANNYPTSTAYAWLRDGAAIAGQAGSTYNVTAEDEGALITCKVTMANGAGSASAQSNGLTVPKREAEKHEEAKHEEEAKPTSSSSSGSGTQPATGTAPAQVPPPGTASATNGKATSGRSVSVTLSCSGKAACQGSLKLTVKRKGKTITIGTASFNIAVGAHRAVAVKLNPKGEKLLGEAGKKGLQVKLSGTGVKPRTLTVH